MKKNRPCTDNLNCVIESNKQLFSTPWYYWLTYLAFILLVVYLIDKTSLTFYLVLMGAVFLLIFAQIAKNPFLGLILIVFFLPFERIPTIDIASFTVKINHVLGIITIISWLGLVLIKKRKIAANALSWPLIIFITTLLISVIFSSYLPRSIVIFAFVVFVAFLSILTLNLVTEKKHLEKITIVLFWSALLVCLFGLWQFFGDAIGLPQTLTGLKEGYTKAVFGFPRIQAFSIEPLYLGNYLFIPLGIFISLFIRKVKIGKISRFWQFSLIVLMLIVLALTLSRGAYVGFGILIFTIFIFYARYWFGGKVIAAIIISLIIAVSGTYYFLSKGESGSLEQFIEHATLGDITAGESIQGRLTEFDRAIEMWQKNPIVGIGLGDYGIVKKDFPDPEDMPDWDIVNNQYIELLAETGVLGLASFVLLIIALIWRSIIAFYKSRDPFIRSVLVGLLAAFIATMVQYNFFSTLYIIHIWVLIGLLVATQNLAFKETTAIQK